MSKRRPGFSRRTAGWLVAIFAALVVIHYAYHTSAGNLAHTVMGKPSSSATVTFSGEVTNVGNHQLTLTLADTKGDLTNMSRKVTLDQSTEVMAPGKKQATGKSGLKFIKQGDRVAVRGHGTAKQGVQADLVQVNFPPIQGTVKKIGSSGITLSVKGQPAPAVVDVTSNTAYFAPNGQLAALKVGAPVQVWVIPNHVKGSGLTAVTVKVTS